MTVEKAKYELHEGRWNLFKNQDKRSENSPEYTGKVNLDGKLYRINGWIKEGGTGNKYFNGTIHPFDAEAPI